MKKLPLNSAVAASALLLAINSTLADEKASETPKSSSTAAASKQKVDAKGFPVTGDWMVEVEPGKKAWLLVPDGKIHHERPNPEKKGFVEFDYSDPKKPSIKVEGIHNYPQEKARSEKLWETLTADEMRQIYKEAGFALLPMEMNSETDVQRAEFPKVWMFPTGGLLKVSKAEPAKEHFKVRFQFRFFGDPAKKPEPAVF